MRSNTMRLAVLHTALHPVGGDAPLPQRRPLASVYPILYLDALQGKVKDQGAIRNKAIYLALGVGLSGEKELLGLWVSQTEGAKFWLQVLTELRHRLHGRSDPHQAAPDRVQLLAGVTARLTAEALCQERTSRCGRFGIDQMW